MPERFAAWCRWAARLLGARAPASTERTPPFADVGVEPHEVRALGRLVAILLALPSIAGIAAVLLLGGPPLAAPACLALPLLGYLAVRTYPDALAKRARLAAIAETPEVLNYLAMSLRVRPSLDRAVAFAAESGEGPLAARMRRVLWDVHLRTRTRIEDAFIALADACGSWNADLKRAGYVIAHAVREGSRDGMPRALDRALAIVYDGARRRLKDYAASLRGPTTALFALGVLLPLIVGSMLPLLSLSGFSPTSLEPVEPPSPDPVPWLILLDGIFPLVTFLFAHHASSNRPGAATTSRGRTGAPRTYAILAPAPLAAVGALAFPEVVPPMAALAAVVFLVAIASYTATRNAWRDRRHIEELEQDFPDALFQLGSRLGEGRSFEDAVVAVSDGIRGTAAGDLMGRMARALRLGGGSVEGALLGPGGLLREVESRSVRATVKMVADIAAKDPEAAGRAALEMSTHLRDLQGVERDLRAELRPSVDAMRATATVFAPIVLGVTGALYGLLASAFATVATLPMPPPVFHVALGVYLALATAGILHFVTRVEHGGDPAAFGASLARTLPVGFAVYGATLLAAGLAF